MCGSSLAVSQEEINDLDEVAAVRRRNVNLAVRALVELWCVHMSERAHARPALR
jgi:hypothetical protein